MNRTTLISALCGLLMPIMALHAQDDPAVDAPDVSAETPPPDAAAADTASSGDTSEADEVALDEAPTVAGESIWTRDKILGDVLGTRTAIGEHGVSLDLRLSQYFQSVTGGGAGTGGEYGGTVDYRLNIDAGKLFGAKGLFFNMHARSRFGQDINADAGALALENTGLLMPLPGEYSGTNITGLTVMQMFPISDDHIGMISAGKLDVIDLVTLFFPNVGYGQEGFWNVNSMVTAHPWFGAVQGLSLYGGFAATMNTKYQMGQSGLIVTGTENVTTSWGSAEDSFGDGVWLSAFHRFFWELDEKMGYLMVFVGGSTKEQASADPLDFAFVPGQGIVDTEEEKPWDIALYVSQDIWQAEGDPTRKASFLIGGTVGPDNPQFAELSIFSHVEVFGLFASRPHDRAGIAAFYTGLSENYKDLVSVAGINVRDIWGFEVYYNAEITPWFHLTPDLQVVQNALDEDDPAVILGIRAVLDF